ncbi:hypothetical protein [Bradyrhizobium elkanii]|uniref:Cytochrome c-type biogenesis protein CcmH/NrfG n=1 Tax=Bradyrhizobium elkanii TaxID=29448 RepID=A0A8I1Y9H5_BRAEL|nr:hypothetical protein [Bradyrhizobium elkanii]MBP1294281.1 cytochrome c-type biogenesis protein CcmH/NrfG [Bradyrhizobium elkanii]
MLRSDHANMPIRGNSAFSIRLMLLSAVTALTLLALGAFGWNAAGAWQRYQAARHTQEFDAGVNKFIAGLFEVLQSTFGAHFVEVGVSPRFR